MEVETVIFLSGYFLLMQDVGLYVTAGVVVIYTLF